MKSGAVIMDAVAPGVVVRQREAGQPPGRSVTYPNLMAAAAGRRNRVHSVTPWSEGKRARRRFAMVDTQARPAVRAEIAGPHRRTPTRACRLAKDIRATSLRFTVNGASSSGEILR